MPWYVILTTRIHKGQFVVSRSVLSTIMELELDHNWPWVLEGLMAKKEL